MEKTGLIDDIVQSLDATWEVNKDLAASPAMKARNQSINETLSLLKEVKATKNLTLALGVEELFLRQELATYANSPEQHNSVNMAIKQLQEAKKSLAVVHNHEAYQAVAETYSPKRKEAGLPIDSFREFLKSHNARLTNLMKGPLSVPEKNILRQRKEILGMVREVYMGMQRNALGIEAPAKDRGLGR